MLDEYPFMFKKVGERIQYINVNLKFRAEKNSPFHKSVETHKSNSILASTKIVSEPHSETGAILANLGDIFLNDIEKITMKSQGVYSFDKKDSYFKEIKSLPEYLQPKILSAVAYVNSVAPNLNKAVERINTIREHLSDKEVMWVMSLLTFEKLLDIVKDSKEFENYTTTMKERTIQ